MACSLIKESSSLRRTPLRIRLLISLDIHLVSHYDMNRILIITKKKLLSFSCVSLNSCARDSLLVSACHAASAIIADVVELHCLLSYSIFSYYEFNQFLLSIIKLHSM